MGKKAFTLIELLVVIAIIANQGIAILHNGTGVLHFSLKRGGAGGLSRRLFVQTISAAPSG